jgi:hypothetical protein
MVGRVVGRVVVSAGGVDKQVVDIVTRNKNFKRGEAERGGHVGIVQWGSDGW